jgi:hypothetical protein
MRKRDAEHVAERLRSWLTPDAPRLSVYRMYDDDDDSYVIGVIDEVTIDGVVCHEVIVELVTAE